MKIIKLALRSILNFRTYSSINLLGLALSLACVITIFRYVYGELTVDRFNKNIDRIYVTTRETGTDPGNIEASGLFNMNREKSFLNLQEHPGVELFSHFMWFENDEISVENTKYTSTVIVADSNFLKITDYPVVSGVHRLADPSSALITTNFAQKIFGKENPVGKTFKHSTGKILTVTGVIGKPSTKASLTFDLIVSYHLSNWSRIVHPQTYVLLYPGVDYRQINKQYESFSEKTAWQQPARYQLFPLSKLYFEKSISNYRVFARGNYSYVAVLMAVGALILLVGIISYINVYAVAVLRRGKELAIKKVFGAGRSNIFIQLFVENLLMTGLALFSSFVIVYLAYPFTANVLQLDQVSGFNFNLFMFFILLLTLPVLLTLYPFFRYYYSIPVNSLRNLDKVRGGGLRRMFLSFQYVITFVMIIVSLFFFKQLRFMLNTDTGYQTRDIIKVHFTIPESYDHILQIDGEIRQKMNACPLFTNWTYGQSPNEFPDKGWVSFKLPEGQFKAVNYKSVDESWFKLFDIHLKEGQLWDDQKEDGFWDYALIVTESVLKLYGITDIDNALLQPATRLWWDSERGDMRTNPPYRIVGVVKDFDYLHLSQKPDPVAFAYSKRELDEQLLASIVPGRTQAAIAFLRKMHEETVGGEFSCSFVEDEVQAMYREDRKIASIYSLFTFIAIFVSALGLLSMSLFDLRQRRKEIAIRKINGATFHDIIRLLLKKYFWTITLSFIIATPIALLAIRRYLEDFAHKAPVSWWLFAIAMILTTGISLLTLLYQTRKAANQNPAEVIKN